MHGCGHDGHTTMLLAAARYLHETRRFDGTAYLFFQPGEEGHAGAKAMIDDGLFERFPAQSVYALHNWPALAPGQFGITPGPAMAAADRIEIAIEGRGGHGAHPHAAVDPVLVAGHIITAAQSIVSRNVSPLDTAVVSLCALTAGNVGAMSVIPARATLVGTVRSFRPATQEMIERRLTELVGSIAAAFGARATLKYERIYPATVNHEREAAFAADVAASLVGSENVVRNLEPSMGSEDFSFMLRERPGAFARLGQGGAELGCFLHNSRYDFNDAVIPLGAGYLAALAEQALSSTGEQGRQ
jgi:hippurate hydrolase